MGVLQSTDGTAYDLPARALLGRSPACDITFDDPSVSGEHAVLTWRNGGWEIRDLGSRNGTWLHERRLVVGQPTVLTLGSEVRFGGGDSVLRLVEVAPPVPRAVALPDGPVVLADGDLLAFPDDKSPAVMVVRAGSGWQIEGVDSIQPVADRHRVQLGPITWELHLPQGLPSTLAGPVGLDSVSLGFCVSSDEEHATWFVDVRGNRTELGDRVHTYLLLTLARARLEDTGEPEASRGWCYADDLAERLGITPENLKVYVYRARKQLQAAGIAGAAGLVERRATSNQIRIGVDALTVQRL